ncbi:MAG: peptidyl-prolyl cis-trans isomerase [Pseudomonadota bacterium]|jgi:peptidyl-prolyl cis-trans isomerase D
MLQSIRDKAQGWITSTVIGLLIIIFALWGIHGYLELNVGKENKVVASVAGQSLSQSDFDKAYQRVYQQTRERLGGKFVNNEKMAEQLRRQTIQQWEETQVLAQAALQARYRISQTLIDSVLLNIPAFQSAGRFSLQHFYDVLNTLNYTKFQFLDDLKKLILINQVQEGIVQSAFALPEDINKSIDFINQKRDFAYLIIPYANFLAKQFSIPDSQALTYYQQNKQDFAQAEQVRIEYIELLLSKEEKEGKIFAEAKNNLANLTYTHPDCLDLAAKKLGLPIQSTAFFGKTGGKQALTKNPKIIAAAFSQDVLQGNNSPIIDINAERAIVLRVKQHKLSGIQPFTDVREKIQKILNKQMAIAKAQAYGQDIFKKLIADSSYVSNLGKKSLSWKIVKQASRYSDQLNVSILNAAFKLVPPNKKSSRSSVLGFSLENGDYALVSLIAVHKDQANKILVIQKQNFYREKLAKDFGQLDYRLYTQDLLKKAKLVVSH